jgi:CheY-like chemotaxis protein
MESPTVLLVDDDSSIQTILYQLLEEGGCNVLAAGNGSDALDICRQRRHPITLLLTDVTLMKILFMSGDADNGSLHLEGFQGV